MTTESCIHFWRLESPGGPTSKGVCKKCGAVGEWINSFTNERGMLRVDAPRKYDYTSGFEKKARKLK
jgi:hypothetical protein